MAKRITRRMRESKCRLRQQRNARAVPSASRRAAFAAMPADAAVAPAVAAVPAALPVGNEASTYGFDTAFAIRVADANAAIEKAGTSPTSFAYEEPDHSCSIKGQFGPWRIGPGGDGKLIHLHIPIPSGELTMSTPTAITGATAEVEVLLHFLPHTDTKPSDNGVDHDLILKTTVDEGDDKVATVTDLYFDDPAHALGIIHKGVAMAALEAWLNANIEGFSHVFSTVNLNGKADTDDFQWLRPTYTTYAYIDGDTADDGLLGVLCMTKNRPPIGLYEQLSSAAVPPGARAGFLISQSLFLEEMVIANLRLVFPGSSKADFALMQDGRGVEAMHSIQLQDVQHVTPTLESFAFRIDEQTVTFEAQTCVEVSKGIYSHCDHTSLLTIALVDRYDGSQTLTFQALPSPPDHTWPTTDEGVTIDHEIEQLIGLVLAGLIIILTDGAAAAVGLMIVGLLVGAMQVSTQIIETVHENDAPPIDLLVLNSTKPIRWPDSGDFSLTSAGLNGSLQLGGDPHFANS